MTGGFNGVHGIKGCIRKGHVHKVTLLRFQVEKVNDRKKETNEINYLESGVR